MAILTGSKIIEEVKNGNIEITDFDESRINPNSYNLRLAPTLKVYNGNPSILERVKKGSVKTANFINPFDLKQKFGNVAILDMNYKNSTREVTIPSGGFLLEPGELYLARTVERTFTDKYVPVINGRSSVGRLGISIHVTAGFGDVGFDGTWTLEITAEKPVVIYPDVEICQIYFETVEGETDIQYQGRYQHQKDAEASKFNEKKFVYVGDAGFVNGKFDEFGKPADEETAKLMKANTFDGVEYVTTTNNPEVVDAKDLGIEIAPIKEGEPIFIYNAEEDKPFQPTVLDNDGNPVDNTEVDKFLETYGKEDETPVANIAISDPNSDTETVVTMTPDAEIKSVEEKPKKTTTRKKSTSSTTKKTTTTKKATKPKEEVKSDAE